MFTRIIISVVLMTSCGEFERDKSYDPETIDAYFTKGDRGLTLPTPSPTPEVEVTPYEDTADNLTVSYFEDLPRCDIDYQDVIAYVQSAGLLTSCDGFNWKILFIIKCSTSIERK